MDQLPRLGKRELICLLLFTCNYVVFVRRGLLKNGRKSKAENYRPISLTSAPGKLMERLVRNAIVEHVTENNLFSTSQHGFISGKSCIIQLLEFMEDITESIGNGKDVELYI